MKFGDRLTGRDHQNGKMLTASTFQCLDIFV